MLQRNLLYTIYPQLSWVIPERNVAIPAHYSREWAPSHYTAPSLIGSQWCKQGFAKEGAKLKLKRFEEA